MYFHIYRDSDGGFEANRVLFPLRRLIIELYDDDDELLDRTRMFCPILSFRIKNRLKRRKKAMLRRAKIFIEQRGEV